MSYNSKYTGAEVEEKLDKIDSLNAGMEDTDESVEDVVTLPFVSYIEQVLTEEQKAQARENIGVDGVSGSTPVVDHGIEDTTFTLTPNTFHKWGEVVSLTLTLGQETEGLVNNFLFQFESGSETPSLILQEDIEWQGGMYPNIIPNAKYQVSIIDKLANVSMYYKKSYLTITALEDIEIAFPASLEYRINGGTWKTAKASEAIPLSVGNVIQYRAALSPVKNTGIGTFAISGRCALSGNCMSLLYGDNANTITDISDKKYAFSHLFENCTGITYVSKGFLPATIIGAQAYEFMFHNCTSLITAPELPATTLGTECYYVMFWNCTSLVDAPSVLPALNLANRCCYSMFYGCSSLIIAPFLPATTLIDECYSHMFYDCINLNYVKASFTTIPSDTYTKNWLMNVASSGTFVKNKNATWNVSGVNGVPNGWTVKTE